MRPHSIDLTGRSWNDLSEVRDAFAPFRQKAVEYWHTEGNFDFLAVLSAKRRAAWRFQFMNRAFAAGVSKICVMDPSTEERAAVKAYVAALPRQFPMIKAEDGKVKVLSGKVAAFRHLDGTDATLGQVWIVWSIAGTEDVVVQIPVIRDRVRVVGVDGVDSTNVAAGDTHAVTINLKGDPKMATGVIVIDRPA